MITEKELLESMEYKRLITGHVDLIYRVNNYSYIVITDNTFDKEIYDETFELKYNIARFIEDKDYIYGSVEYSNLSDVEVFKKLLNRYSRSLT